ncbi:MAG: hypothetical protein COY81_01230 [Candidatus Pacebacteria bacterium CG_4_10_14_0_8_um_filter_43_12]|nr:MAG: hypothetical protein COY81_01230 [Candidatus Pacebacteria bacterium CG_4_10_14_0_8_um_filter_43_12]
MPSIYIDESGYPDILSYQYRFFIMTGVVINDEEVSFAHKLLDNWKKKHSLSLDCGFHAYDLFETNANNANQLRTNRIFSKATTQLIDIIKMVDFQSYCAVVDLKKLRKSFSISEPPNKKLFKDQSSYRSERKKYVDDFIKAHGEDNRYKPLEFCLSYLLIYSVPLCLDTKPAGIRSIPFS